MLTLLLLIPLLGSLIILPMSNTLENKNLMKKIALITSLINFFISLFLWYNFDSSISKESGDNLLSSAVLVADASGTQFQFVSEFNQLNFCHLNFGIDGISLFFVLLTTFITPIALLSNFNLGLATSPLSPAQGQGALATNFFLNKKNKAGEGEQKNIKIFLISILFLETLQICAFVSLDLLLFYIFFESVLPLLFIMIIIYGHGKDRFRSAFLFFLYTLAGSLPMLLSILVLYSYIGSTDFQLISLYEISLDSQKFLWLSLPFSTVDMTSRKIKNLNTLHLPPNFFVYKKIREKRYPHSKKRIEKNGFWKIRNVRS
jgi:NADH:ubiquinone oxidoreductase subunit 4 (subunit M)